VQKAGRKDVDWKPYPLSLSLQKVVAKLRTGLRMEQCAPARSAEMKCETFRAELGGLLEVKD
jgi:hypothetical protein